MINETYGAGTATPIDSVSVVVRGPQDMSQKVAFLGDIELMEVETADPVARVVINSRTGTAVINRAVRVGAAAVSHGTLMVRIDAFNEVSQPNAFADGDTVPIQNAEITVTEEDSQMFVFEPGIELQEIVDAVNQVGASPSALIAILEALKRAGSLKAELVVI